MRDAAGLEQSIRFQNGIELDWERGPGGQPLARRTYRRTSGRAHAMAVPLGHREELGVTTYEWRGDDQLAAMIDELDGARFFDHDPRGQLIRELSATSQALRLRDPAGNVYPTADRGSRAYGPGGRLDHAEGARYEYDADGNQVSRIDARGAWRHRYNGHGMLTAIERPAGERLEFEYDAFARRTCKRRLNAQGMLVSLTRFVWDEHNVIHEIDGNGDVRTWHYKPGSFTLIAREQRGRVSFVATDHVGAPTEMYDAQGRVEWRMRLDIDGVPRVVVGAARDCPWRWPGQYEDGEVPGLVYNRHRYYATDQRCYLTDDPLFLLTETPRGYVPDPLLQYDPLGWHLANAWFTPAGGTRAPVGNPDMGGANRWPNVPGSGDADMAPNGLGRAGDSENLILSHLEGTRAGEMQGGVLEIASTPAHGSSLPPCPSCGAGMQNFADRHGVTVVYTQTGRRGQPVGEPRVFHPAPPGGCS